MPGRLCFFVSSVPAFTPNYAFAFSLPDCLPELQLISRVATYLLVHSFYPDFSLLSRAFESLFPPLLTQPLHTGSFLNSLSYQIAELLRLAQRMFGPFIPFLPSWSNANSRKYPRPNNGFETPSRVFGAMLFQERNAPLTREDSEIRKQPG